jgi:hypothetical protein
MCPYIAIRISGLHGKAPRVLRGILDARRNNPPVAQRQKENTMPIKEDVLIEETLPEEREIPEVEVFGDEAVIHLERPEEPKERRVRLPKTTWA